MRHFSARVMPMDSYDVSNLPTEHLVLFVASTTGQVCQQAEGVVGIDLFTFFLTIHMWAGRHPPEYENLLAIYAEEVTPNELVSNHALRCLWAGRLWYAKFSVCPVGRIARAENAKLAWHCR